MYPESECMVQVVQVRCRIADSRADSLVQVREALLGQNMASLSSDRLLRMIEENPYFAHRMDSDCCQRVRALAHDR